MHELWTLDNDHSVQKTALWRDVPTLLRQFPLLGISRGAFFAVYTRYRQSDLPQVTFSHLENEWLQTFVDFGPWVGGALIGLTVFAAYQLVRAGLREAQWLGLAAALLFLGVHNLTDFNLELTAVALPALLILALFAAQAAPRQETLWPRRLGLVAAVAFVATAPGALMHRIKSDTALLQRELELSQSDFPVRAQALMAWHPGDYLMPLLVSQHYMLRKRFDVALQWINRAMFLAPSDATAHHHAARALLSLGATEQSAGEYRTACRLLPEQTTSWANELWQATRDSGLVASLADGRRDDVSLAVGEFLLAEGQNAAALTTSTPRQRDTNLSLADLASRAMIAERDVAAALGVAANCQRLWPRDRKSVV